MENDCIFCKIIKKEIDSDIVYEDDDMMVIKDIRPKARIHLLVMPKKHIRNFNEVKEEDRELLGKMMFKIKEIVKEKGIDESGYKIVINTNKEGGQIIYHLHIHILGGEPLLGVV